jgi:hypothetical protein
MKKKNREAAQNVKRQKSLGLYSDSACQTLGSTTPNPGRMVRLFRVGSDQQTGQEAHKTQKNKTKKKINPSFLEKRLDFGSDDAYPPFFY